MMSIMKIEPSLCNAACNAANEFNKLKLANGAYCNKVPRSLEVSLKDVIGKMEGNDSYMSMLSSILQSIDDSMSLTIKNMTLSPKEQKELEEKLASVRKIEKLAKEEKIDNLEALKLLKEIVTDEDKKLIDEQYAADKMAFA